ncbi:hypothetical protein [uncultured Mediterranean phage uvMED]|nr:hypothetical protein [uncultured Mediterranean phage uvMED]
MKLAEFGMDKFEAGAESSGGGARVKPGRYDLQYSHSEKKMNEKGWQGLILHFDVVGEAIRVSKSFAMVNPVSEKNVEIGQQSLSLMLNAMGVGSLKDTDQLAGKRVEAELVVNERGYLEINDNFGKTWMPAGTTTASENLNPKEELPKEEMFPSDVDDEDDLPF